MGVPRGGAVTASRYTNAEQADSDQMVRCSNRRQHPELPVMHFAECRLAIFTV